MSHSNDNLTKICNSCGQPKPLTAFLKMPGVKGTVIYGNLCTDCRKANLEKLKLNERDETTRSGTGYKIDAKAKMADDTGKANDKLQTDHDYHEERDEKAENSLAKEAKDQQLIKKEREHRDTFLKKPSESTDKAVSGPQTAAQIQAAKEGKVDMKVAQLDIGQVKAVYQSAEFNRFKTWLGASSPIGRQAERMAAKIGIHREPQAEKNQTTTAGSEKKADAKSSLFGEKPENKAAQTTSAAKPDEKKPNTLFAGIANKKPEAPSVDPIEFAKKNTPPRKF